MEDSSSIPVHDPANPGKSRRRQQFSILLACVLIATALWFLRAFENTYTTRVENPVTYINLPDQMITLSPLPQRISLEVKGMGFSVLRHNWDFSKTPLIIDFKTIKSVSAKKKKGFVEYLPMNQYCEVFSTHLSGLKVLSIIPDTITFRFALLKTRKIKVIPAFENEPGASSIAVNLISITPDSVEVEGPDVILDTIQSIRTMPIKLNRQGFSPNRSMELKGIDKLVKYTPAKVSVSISKKNPD